MFQSDKTDLIPFGEVIIKLFAIYFFFYHLFTLIQTFGSYNYARLFYPERDIQLLQLSIPVLTATIPVIVSAVLLWRGRQIARWLLPADAALDVEQIKSKYIISLLLMIISVYYIFSGAATVIGRLVHWFLFNKENMQILVSGIRPGIITGSIKLIFAFFLLLYIKPVANWLNSRIMNSEAGEKRSPRRT